MESRPNDNSGADAVNEADQRGAQHNAGVNIVTPGRSLEPHRRLRLGRQQPPVRRDGPLDRAQAHVDPLLPHQVLAHHLGIAAVLEEALLQPRLLILELAAAGPSAVRHPTLGRNVASHRVLAAPELPGDAPQPPTERPQVQHRLHLV